MEKIIRRYHNLAGVDFLNTETSLYRSPDAKNIYKSYKNGNVIETRMGIEKVFSTIGVLYGLYFFEHSSGTQVIVHAGTKLYKWNNFPNTNTTPEDVTELYSGMNAHRSSFFVFNNNLYILDGLNYLMYDTTECEKVLGFVPTTSIGRQPSGGGSIYQPINLLSSWRYNLFVADGTTKDYQLDAIMLDADMLEVKVNGIEIIEDVGYTVNRTTGTVTFGAAPPTPLTVGDNNVSIKCKKTISGYYDRIQKCTILTEFDNRIFFSGNQTFPNSLFHSELENPAYVSDLAYYSDGLDTCAIKSLVSGNNQLWALKEAGQGNATVYYHVPTIDYSYGKIYPSRKGKVSTGCLSEGINFNDDIVFISKEGLIGITGDIESEQLLSNRSSLINSKFTNEIDYNKTQLTEWNGYLLCLVNGKIYLADSRQKFSSVNGYEYEWYYWDNIGTFETAFNKATLIKEYKGKLYIGTDGYIAEFKGLLDDGKAIVSYWTTSNDLFGFSNRLKTTNKMGGVAKLKGNCSLSVITDSNSTDIKTFTTSQLDYVVFKVKKKKWMELQLKFHSTQHFELHNATIESFVAGYKRR